MMLVFSRKAPRSTNSPKSEYEILAQYRRCHCERRSAVSGLHSGGNRSDGALYYLKGKETFLVDEITQDAGLKNLLMLMKTFLV